MLAVRRKGGRKIQKMNLPYCTCFQGLVLSGEKDFYLFFFSLDPHGPSFPGPKAHVTTIGSVRFSYKAGNYLASQPCFDHKM